mmetsp:Transcript_32958/g.64887  ORF Transcript_32958/g.64887 Transcript_32958/m.64887 type:complete len:124 (-) Transcript_32958:277-648(-)
MREAAYGLPAVPAVASTRLVLSRVVRDLILGMCKPTPVAMGAFGWVRNPSTSSIPIPESAICSDGWPPSLSLEMKIEALHGFVQLAMTRLEIEAFLCMAMPDKRLNGLRLRLPLWEFQIAWLC